MNTQVTITIKEKSKTAKPVGICASKAIAACLCLLIGLSLSVYSQTKSPKGAPKGKPMKTQAKGTFDVKVIPVPPDEKAQETGIGRFLLDKQFHGDLEASSKGEMIASGSPASGSGGYVAMEKVSGILNGRKGSFMLQHNGTMQGGAAEMNVVVIPGSGTEELAGIEGKLTIIIADGKHSYEFEYTLP